jgi:hypothetical protein
VKIAVFLEYLSNATYGDCAAQPWRYAPKEKYEQSEANKQKTSI